MAPPLTILGAGLALVSVTPFAAVVIVWGAADVLGRYRDYRYLSRFEYMTHRLALFYGRSYCGRRLVSTLYPTMKTLYHSKGYRWYHILPDEFPHILVRRQFWRTLWRGHSSYAIKKENFL